MLKRIAVYVSFILITIIGFTAYRSSLIQQGRAEAVAEYRKAEAALLKQHEEEVNVLVNKAKELQSTNTEKSNEVNLYRNKFSAAAERLREQQASLDRSVEDASSASLRDYASAVKRNFDEARGYVEQFGLEAASCSITAETLSKALELANRQ